MDHYHRVGSGIQPGHRVGERVFGGLLRRYGARATRVRRTVDRIMDDT
jgi:hypothetical protein